MRQDHPDLLTTLRDVAATTVTLLDTFAQIRRERTAQPPPPAPSPTPQAEPDEPTDASAPQADRDDAPNPRPTAADRADRPDLAHAIFLATLPRAPEMTRMEAAHRRLVGPIRRMDARESQQWAPARKLADSINDRLFEIAELAHNAIKEDGLRTLPILDALLERLHGEFRDRTGPFAAVPDLEVVS